MSMRLSLCQTTAMAAIGVAVMTADVLAQSPINAHIYLDLASNHTGAGVSRDKIGSDQLDKPLADYWRFDVDGSSTGYRHENVSGKTVRGMIVRIEKPELALFHEGDCDGGDLFPYVEVRDGGKEVVFGGANIPADDFVWSRFPNRKNGTKTIYYLGTALTTDPTPDGFQPGNDAAGRDAWKAFWDSLPSSRREVQAYGVSPSGQFLCVITPWGVYVYAHKQQLVHDVAIRFSREDQPINRVSFETVDGKDGRFLLWDKWEKVGTVDLSELHVYETTKLE